MDCIIQIVLNLRVPVPSCSSEAQLWATDSPALPKTSKKRININVACHCMTIKHIIVLQIALLYACIGPRGRGCACNNFNAKGSGVIVTNPQ